MTEGELVSVCFIPSPKACRRRERGKKKKSIDLQFDFSPLPLLSDGQPRWHLDVHRRARADTAQTQGLFISASQLMYVCDVAREKSSCQQEIVIAYQKRGGKKWQIKSLFQLQTGTAAAEQSEWTERQESCCTYRGNRARLS